jgi:hypothetical protein
MGTSHGKLPVSNLRVLVPQHLAPIRYQMGQAYRSD